jgi:hypothetical protein
MIVKAIEKSCFLIVPHSKRNKVKYLVQLRLLDKKRSQERTSKFKISFKGKLFLND